MIGSGEKRSDRLELPKQLRVSETLGRAVRQLAARECRPIQLELLVLIMEGLEQRSRKTGKEVDGVIRQGPSGPNR